MGINVGGGGKKIERGVGLNLGRLQLKKPVGPIKNPFGEKEQFRLGLYEILEEKDNYLLCKGYDPNAERATQYTPGAHKTIKVAKPALLNRSLWDGKTIEVRVDGEVQEVTYEYDDDEVGKRTATWTADGVDYEEVQRIYVPYFVGDTITACEMRKDAAVDGIDTKTENDGLLTYVDLNFGGRCWRPPTEAEFDFGKTSGTISAFDGTTFSSGSVATYNINDNGTLEATGDSVTAFWAFQDNDLASGSWVTLQKIKGHWFAEPTSCNDLA